MPVNAFNGTHNWGYDGVLWYAVHEPYGGPQGYQAFVDACHRGRARRHPGRRLQPPGSERQLSAAVRPVPELRRHQHLGRVAQPRRRGLRRGPALHHRLRADVPHRLSRRRPPAGRRACPARHPGHPSARGAGDRRRRAQRLPRPAVAADRRVGPERSAADQPAPRGRLRPGRPVERRLPPRALRQPDRRHQWLLRRLRLPRSPGQGLRGRLLP